MLLVDDLLDVSRITRGKVEIKRGAVELSTAVAKALETASPLLEQRRHAVHVAVPRTGLAVEGDEARLAQVFANLLTNSAKYTEPGGNVWVTGRREGGKAIVEVRDDGIGMAAGIIPSVFDLFVQGNKSIERTEGGLGIGLTLVRSLVRLHGGEVTARSDGPGRGSAFTVELPALAADARIDTPVEIRRARTRESGQSRRVLLVDDNEDAAELLAMALRDAGYRVELAFDGAQALERAAAFSPQLAILDIGLPVMDGYELASRLRETHEALRLIALTGYGQEHDREKSRRAGFDAHLVKPVELEVLLAALDLPGVMSDH
jgi:CheY-like chemotaxis protein